MPKSISKHTISRYFCTITPCTSSSCIFELSHFCRTFLRNYNWYFFIGYDKQGFRSHNFRRMGSLAFFCHRKSGLGWLPCPISGCCAHQNFTGVIFGGRCGEGQELLLDIKLFLLLHPRLWLAYIKSASINIFSTPSY